MARSEKQRTAAHKAKVRRREERRGKDARQAARDPFQNAWRLPLRDCMVSRQWRETRMARFMVSRERHDGTIALANGLVDLGCLGLKDGWLLNELDPEGYERTLTRLASGVDPLVPCDLALARAILVRAVAYAAGLGFEPHRTYPQVLQVLGPPAHGEVLPEVTCGEDGKPLYIAGPHDDSAAIIAVLQRRFGPEGFHFIAPLGAEP